MSDLDEMLEAAKAAAPGVRIEFRDLIAAQGARGYWASYFLRAFAIMVALDYARQLLRSMGTSDGFQRLTDEHRLDLTVEALVLRPEYTPLFTDEERRIAAHRLAQAGYSPSH